MSTDPRVLIPAICWYRSCQAKKTPVDRFDA